MRTGNLYSTWYIVHVLAIIADNTKFERTPVLWTQVELWSSTTRSKDNFF
jgi:hypothetical protein